MRSIGECAGCGCGRYANQPWRTGGPRRAALIHSPTSDAGANNTPTRPFQRKHAVIHAIDHGENLEPGKRYGNSEKGAR